MLTKSLHFVTDKENRPVQRWGRSQIHAYLPTFTHVSMHMHVHTCAHICCERTGLWRYRYVHAEPAPNLKCHSTKHHLSLFKTESLAWRSPNRLDCLTSILQSTCSSASSVSSLPACEATAYFFYVSSHAYSQVLFPPSHFPAQCINTFWGVKQQVTPFDILRVMTSNINIVLYLHNFMDIT